MAFTIHLKKDAGPLAIKDLDKALAGQGAKRRGTGFDVALANGARASLRPCVLKTPAGPDPARATSIEVELEGKKEAATPLIELTFGVADALGCTVHKFQNGPPIGRGTVREGFLTDLEPAFEAESAPFRVAVIAFGIGVISIPFVLFLFTGLISVKLTILCFGGGASLIVAQKKKYF